MPLGRIPLKKHGHHLLIRDAAGARAWIDNGGGYRVAPTLPLVAGMVDHGFLFLSGRVWAFGLSQFTKRCVRNLFSPSFWEGRSLSDGEGSASCTQKRRQIAPLSGPDRPTLPKRESGICADDNNQKIALNEVKETTWFRSYLAPTKATLTKLTSIPEHTVLRVSSLFGANVGQDFQNLFLREFVQQRFGHHGCA